MEHTPLDIQPGDIVSIDLAHPVRYADPNGGDSPILWWTIRMQVDVVTDLGISGRGSHVEGLIVPKKGAEYDRLGGTPLERPKFFPWSSVQSMSRMYTFGEYEELWDAERDMQ